MGGGVVGVRLRGKSAPISSANCCVSGAPPTPIVIAPRMPAASSAWMVVRMLSIVSVISALISTNCGACALTASTKACALTSTPRSTTS